MYVLRADHIFKGRKQKKKQHSHLTNQKPLHLKYCNFFGLSRIRIKLSDLRTERTFHRENKVISWSAFVIHGEKQCRGSYKWEDSERLQETVENWAWEIWKLPSIECILHVINTAVFLYSRPPDVYLPWDHGSHAVLQDALLSNMKMLQVLSVFKAPFKGTFAKESSLCALPVFPPIKSEVLSNTFKTSLKGQQVCFVNPRFCIKSLCQIFLYTLGVLWKCRTLWESQELEHILNWRLFSGYPQRTYLRESLEYGMKPEKAELMQEKEERRKRKATSTGKTEVCLDSPSLWVKSPKSRK